MIMIKFMIKVINVEYVWKRKSRIDTCTDYDKIWRKNIVAYASSPKKVGQKNTKI